jgi:hypothetical protein
MPQYPDCGLIGVFWLILFKKLIPMVAPHFSLKAAKLIFVANLVVSSSRSGTSSTWMQQIRLLVFFLSLPLASQGSGVDPPVWTSIKLIAEGVFYRSCYQNRLSDVLNV